MQQLPGYVTPVLGVLLLATANALAGEPTPAATRAGVASEALVNRYTAISLLPSAADLDPTQTVVHVNFPRMNTKSVGDAVRYLLVRTGYDLVAEDQLQPQVVALLAKRLPDSQRALGPFQVQTMLQILVGPAFEVTTDHSRRMVSFQPVPSAIGATDAPEAVERSAKPGAAALSGQTAH